MTGTSKVLWSEGLFLRPQHLQCQDRHHDEKLWSMAGVVHPFPWGVRRASIAGVDQEMETVSLLKLDAILCTGERIEAPYPDNLPATLSLRYIKPDCESVIVCVTLPPLRHDGDNSAVDTGTGRRYVAREEETVDHFGRATIAPVHFASYCPRLVISGEPGADASALPVLRLKRSTAGRFEVDAAFIAPSLNIAASPPLLERLGRLLDVLHAKVSTLVSEQAEPVRDAVAFRAGDHASFWLLHTVSSAAAALAHIKAVPGVAPEKLYQELLRLAGGLMAFSRLHRVAQLKPYVHEESHTVFESLFKTVSELVDTVIPTRFIPITLERLGTAYFAGSINAGKIDAKSTLYMGVSPAAVGHDLAVTVPLRFKVGAPDDVEKAVTSALPCVRTTHLVQAPPAIPVKPGYTYFMLDSRGGAYERMLKSGSVRVFTPSGMESLSVELFAVIA